MTEAPMTLEEADQVLEQMAEIEAELGMGFVSGGGRAEEAMMFVAQVRSPDQVRIRAEAMAIVDAAQRRTAAAWRREMDLRGTMAAALDVMLGREVYDLFRDADPLDEIPF